MHANIKFISADEAVKYVQSGDHIHFSSVASAPKVLIDALCRRGDNGELKDVRIHHLHTEGEAPYTDAKYEGIFFTFAPMVTTIPSLLCPAPSNTDLS